MGYPHAWHEDQKAEEMDQHIQERSCPYGAEPGATRGYLSEVDGLRALAVLSVVLYHLRSSFLPGGFTGVDVFFVISGYVVSKSLADRPTADFRSYLLDFYARRIVRILPALIVCLLVTSLLTVLFIPTSWLSQTTKKTALAAFYGFSNVALVQFNDGYFSPRIEYNPFVHTWSLAVEEQFYLISPLLLFIWIAARRYDGVRPWAAWAVLPVLALASLAAAYWMSAARPEWAFYLLPARFWELAAGAMLYQCHAEGRLLPSNAGVASAGLAAGLGLTLAGFWLAQPGGSPWPWALLPVLGTVAMIACVVRVDLNGSVLHGWLRHPAMVYIGKGSYSLYLWHWPVFSLFRWTVGLEQPIHMALACFIAGLLAAGSYHGVEQTFRQSAVIRVRPGSVKVAAGFMATVIALVSASQIFAHRRMLSLSVTRDAQIWYPDAKTVPPSGTKPLEGRRLFLVGNSHADAYTPMVNEAAQRLGFQVLRVQTGWCAVGNLLYPINGSEACPPILAQLFAMLERSGRPGDLVFLASLRAHRLVGQWERFDVPSITAHNRTDEAEAVRLKALDETTGVVGKLKQMGLTVLIDAPKPVFLAPAFRCSDWFNRTNPICAGGFLVERRLLAEHREPVMRSMAALASAFDNVVTWDPFPVLCPGETCSAIDQKAKPTFFDGDHLSGHGSRMLSPFFERVLLDIWQPLEPS